MTGHHALFKDLSAIVGPKYVSDDDFVLFAYSMAMDPLPPKIQGIVVRPGSVEDVVEIAKLANVTHTPLMPSGGRASIYGMSPGAAGRAIVVDMKRMDKIISIDESNICVTAQAGISTCELNQRLNERGWGVHTAYQPYYPDTLGGILSGCTGGGGGMRMSDPPGWNVNGYINSIKVVLGNGDILQTSACANFGRGVAYAHEPGGPCTTPLFVGDAGAFGIKVEATLRMFKIRPEQPKREAEPAYFETEEDAFACYKEGVLYDPTPSEQWSLVTPYSARTAMMVEEKWLMVNAWQGFDKGDHESKRRWWHEIVKKHNGVISDNPTMKFVAEGLASGRPYQELGVFGTGGRYVMIEAVAPFGECQACLNTLRHETRTRLEKGGVVSRMSECMLSLGAQQVCSVFFWYDDSNPVESKVAIDTFREVFEAVASKGWTPDVTHGYAAKMMSKYWKPSYVNYMRATKKALDPNNIMNPGVWGEVI